MSTVLNILTLNYEYPPVGGGGGVICADICEEMASRGHEVHVITSRFRDLPPFELRNGVKISRVPVMMREKQDVASMLSMLTYVPSAIAGATRQMKKKPFDIIHTHFAIPTGPASRYLAKRHHIPHILSIHGGDIYDPSKNISPHRTIILKNTVKNIINNATRVVASSTDIINNTRTYYGVNRRIDMIPLGIKPGLRDHLAVGNVNLPDDKIVLLTIGRLVARKDVLQLLEIVRELKSDIPVLLIVIGDGPQKGLLEEHISKWDLQDKVRLVGRVSDEEKFLYLASSDVFVSTAQHEGFGIVFLESMEFGLPIMSYNHGGQADFLQDGKTGFMVELNEFDNFRKKLEILANDRDLRKKIAKYNTEYVRNFYIDRCADRYLEIYDQVLQKSK